MYKDYNIESLRILPMSKELEFEKYSIEELQEKFFFRDLVKRDGMYRYRKSGMQIDGNTLVLFQFENRIIASAVLIDILKTDDDIYKGTYYFDPISIGVFIPVTSIEMINIFNIKQLSQSKQRLDMSKFELFLELLEKKNIRYCNELESNLKELYFTEDKLTLNYKDFIEKRNNSVETLYKRNKRTQKYTYIALKRANFECEFDRSHKWFISEKTNENYVEGHHLIPIAYSNEFENSIDIPANIISLCPLCHKIIHHGIYKDKERIIKQIYQTRNSLLKECGIEISIERLLSLYK